MIPRTRAACCFGVMALVASVASACVPGAFKSLGMRCSGPSTYLQERFHQPDLPGCMPIGVTGAAKRAGLEQGDLITSMNGIPVTSGTQFGTRYADGEGDALTFEVLKAGSSTPQTIVVKLGVGGQIDLPHDDPLFFFEAALSSDNDPDRIKQYSKAIEMAPDFDLAYLRRGQIYFDQCELDAAYEDLTKAVQLNPNWAEPKVWLGFTIYERGTLEEVILDVKSLAEEALAVSNCGEAAFVKYNVDCWWVYQLLTVVHETIHSPKAAEYRERQADFYGS